MLSARVAYRFMYRSIGGFMTRISTLVLGLTLAACSSTTATPAADSGASSLYTRLGGKSGITGAVGLIVADELKDAEVAAFFAGLGKNGSPTGAQLSECLVNQLGAAAGGPASEVTYPTKVTGGYMCRDMKSSHASLMITTSVFDKFVTIAAGTLKTAGVANADIATIGAVLNSTKSDVVTK
jgi:hypothetical protein